LTGFPSLEELVERETAPHWLSLSMRRTKLRRRMSRPRLRRRGCEPSQVYYRFAYRPETDWRTVPEGTRDDDESVGRAAERIAMQGRRQKCRRGGRPK
jgi:hypothetical protein